MEITKDILEKVCLNPDIVPDDEQIDFARDIADILIERGSRGLIIDACSFKKNVYLVKMLIAFNDMEYVNNRELNALRRLLSQRRDIFTELNGCREMPFHGRRGGICTSKLGNDFYRKGCLVRADKLGKDALAVAQRMVRLYNNVTTEKAKRDGFVDNKTIEQWANDEFGFSFKGVKTHNDIGPKCKTCDSYKNGVCKDTEQPQGQVGSGYTCKRYKVRGGMVTLVQ